MAKDEALSGVEIVDAETEKRNASERKLQSSADIEAAARIEVREREGSVIFDDEYAAYEAKNIAGSSAKPEAQTRTDAEPETPEKSDKVEGETEKPADGQPESSVEPDKKTEEGQTETEEPSAETSAEKNYKELQARATRAEQENSLLRGQLAETTVLAAKVNELSRFKDEISPFVPTINTIKDMRDSIKDIVVQPEEMSGVNEQTGEKFATDADKRRALAGSEEAYAAFIRKGIERGITEHEKARTVSQGHVQKAMSELQAKYNDGKPFDTVELSNMLGDKVNRLMDSSVSYETKKEIIEAAVTKILVTKPRSATELTKAELKVLEDKEALRADKSKLLHSQSSLRPKKQLTPEQQKHLEVLQGMDRVLSKGGLPYDNK